MRGMRGTLKAADVKVLGVSGSAVWIAVLNRFAGKRDRFTLWCMCGDRVERRGCELPLGQCRRIAKEAGAL